MTEYLVLSTFTAASLSQQVTERLGQGWALHGELKVVMCFPMEGTPQGSASSSKHSPSKFYLTGFLVDASGCRASAQSVRPYALIGHTALRLSALDPSTKPASSRRGDVSLRP